MTSPAAIALTAPEASRHNATRDDAVGRFGAYGGRFVPEALVAALDELDVAFRTAQADPTFVAELDELHRSYVGRPSVLTVDVPRDPAAGIGVTGHAVPLTAGG